MSAISLEPNPTEPPREARRGRTKGLLLLGAFLALVVALVVAGIRPRLRAERALVVSTDEMAAPTVSTVHPQPTAASRDIVLPATLAAYTDAPIYARTNGYLTRWYADIGTTVAAGQRLADLATPEVDQQLRQAEADLATAEANLRLAQLTSVRYQKLLAQDGVSQQDADNAAGDAQAKASAVESARANVERLQELVGFNHVDAPFAGVITARSVDIGSLVDSGAGAHEMFHLDDLSRLRVYVNVPQNESALVRPGLKASLELPQFPHSAFPATLVSTSQSIDAATRTLLAQFAVANPSRQLLPGSYGELHIEATGRAGSFLVPESALLFRSEGPRLVLVVRGRAELRPVVLGRDYGVNLEIISGLAAGDAVVTNPPDSVVAGEQLRVAH